MLAAGGLLHGRKLTERRSRMCDLHGIQLETQKAGKKASLVLHCLGSMLSLWFSVFKLILLRCICLSAKHQGQILKVSEKQQNYWNPWRLQQKTILPMWQSSHPGCCRVSWFYSGSHQAGSLQDFARQGIMVGDSGMHRGFWFARWRQKQNKTCKKHETRLFSPSKWDRLSFNSSC